MRNETPPLAPYLRSDAQARILTLLLLHPAQSRSLTDIGRLTGVLPAVVHREVSRLVEAGVLLDQRVGRTRLVRADTSYRLIAPLTEILTATYGPPAVLASLLRGTPGVEEGHLVGSWAARHAGEPGAEPGDVDVVVVGDAARTTLNEIAAEAERRLGVPVGISRVSRAAWDTGAEPFVQTVRSRPRLRLELT
jgi:DNA-binding Lrp family transcriptional regulator